MAAVSKSVLAERVRAAVDAAGITQRALAEQIGLTPSALSRALSAKRDFRSLELALIAELLNISIESLTQEDYLPDVTVNLAARIQPGTSPAVSRALERISTMLDIHKLLRAIGRAQERPLEFLVPAAQEAHEQGRQLAIAVRERMNTRDLPPDIESLAVLTEKTLGISVSLEPLPDGLDGVSVRQGEFHLALINTSVSATRQRWTLAHEVGHLVAGDSDAVLVDENVWSGKKSAEETRANAFAAEFLVPTADLLKEARERADLDPRFIAFLLGKYRVSLDSIAFRLHNVGLVDYAGRDRIRSMSSKEIALRPGRLSELQSRQDRKLPAGLMEALFSAYDDGELGIRPLALFIDVDAESLLDELSGLRGGDSDVLSGDGKEVPVL